MEAIAIMIKAFKELGMDKNLIMHTTIAVDAFDDINHMLADERVKREWICEYAFGVAYKIYIVNKVN
tara:strand:- start:400 stop:600 length:201 start_codon:yes stop_codon:yes gene_type:complete